MPDYQWTGDGVFTDASRDFAAGPGTTHTLTEEQAAVYADHRLFGAEWELVATETDTDTTNAPGTDNNGTDPGPNTDGSDDTETESETDSDSGDEDADLEALPGVGPAKADDLRAAGYESLDDLRAANEDDLAAVTGISAGLAETITNEVN